MKSFYFASNTKYAHKWIELREQGLNIISTWINEAGPGDSPNLIDLAIRCIEEPKQADVTVLYSDEACYLKFALAEVGAALGAGKWVIVVGGGPSISATMLKHPKVINVATLRTALYLIRNDIDLASWAN